MYSSWLTERQENDGGNKVKVEKSGQNIQKVLELGVIMSQIRQDYAGSDEHIIEMANLSMKRPDDFGYWGDIDMFNSWGFAGIDMSRDASCLDESNFQAFHRDIVTLFPDDFSCENFGHWAVGSLDRTLVRVLKDEHGDLEVENITDALSNFQGEIMQTPPMYSAIKIKGKRLYELARNGVVVHREPRKVSIHNLSCIEFEPPVLKTIIECGKGFYVRTFADDLGQILGCGAFLKSLRRLSSGPFRIEQSTKLNKVLLAFEEGRSFEILQEPGICIEEAQRLDLTELETQLVQDGRRISALADKNPHEDSGMARAYSPDGHLVAVMRHDFASSEWRPEKVFN